MHLAHKTKSSKSNKIDRKFIKFVYTTSILPLKYPDGLKKGQSSEKSTEYQDKSNSGGPWAPGNYISTSAKMHVTMSTN